MDQISKAEQLRLPEQLYILLVDPDTGDPRYSRQKVEHVLATAIIWELLDAGAFKTQGNRIKSVKVAMFEEGYLRRAALHTAGRVPADGHSMIWEVAGELHPIWKTVGEGMVAKHLVAEDVQTRFVFFHRKVLMELFDARNDAQELSQSLAQAARNLWDANYDAQLARTHPRLLARLVLLDNHKLLEPLIGSTAYFAAVPYLTDIRSHLHEMVRDPKVVRPHHTSDTGGCDSGGSDCHIYDSGSDFWIDSSDDGGHGGHGGHDGGHDGHSGHDSAGDSGDSSGGGSSDGGCGGCGGGGGGGD